MDNFDAAEYLITSTFNLQCSVTAWAYSFQLLDVICYLLTVRASLFGTKGVELNFIVYQWVTTLHAD